MKTITCKTSITGFAHGPVFALKKYTANYPTTIQNTDDELKRLIAAVKNVEQKLQDLKDTSDATTKQIIDSHIMLLADPDLMQRVEQQILENNYSCEYALKQTGTQILEEFNKTNDDFFISRGMDVVEVTHSIINELSHTGKYEYPDRPSIILADNISVEYISGLDKSLLLGVITNEGFKTSHLSIILGSLNIPYMYDANIASPDSYNDKYSAIDTDTNSLIIEPATEVLESIKKKKRIYYLNLPIPVEYNYDMKICANIISIDEVNDELVNNCDGVGLFRTEFLYMNSSLPDEEEQYKIYSRVLKDFGSKNVTIRVADIGSDKEISAIPVVREPNPALGHRGIRFLFEHEDIFITQLKALLRAATCGNLSIMYPLITSVEEIIEIKDMLHRAANILKNEGKDYVIPPQGIMIETPAAALISDRLATLSDFFSIGTNDLTQYTLACDRTGHDLERFYKPHHEAIITLIKMVVDNAHKANIPVSICGELSSDKNMLPLFMEIQTDKLSMSPIKINRIKQYIMTQNKTKKILDSMTNNHELLSLPSEGELTDISLVPDPVFSEGILGKGIAVKPDNGYIYAPCDCTIESVSEQGHAIGLKSKENNSIIIHVGIDTYNYDSNIFSPKVKKGDSVKRGTLIMQYNLDSISKSANTNYVIMVFPQE